MTLSADADLNAVDPNDLWGGQWTFPYPYSAGIPSNAPPALSAGSTWALRANMNYSGGLNPSPGYEVFECEQGQWARRFARSASGSCSFSAWVKTTDFGSSPVTSVNGKTGDVSIAAALPITLNVSGS